MTISTITALPTAPARTDAPATFISRADAFLAALVTMVTELNTSIGEMNTDIAGVDTNVVLAQNWATKNDAAVTGSDWSAFANASGAAPTGSAKDWASKTAGQIVADGEYSAKSYSTDSAASATSAGTSATNAATSANNAQIYAAAAQAAVGVPTLSGNAGKALAVNTAENGVEWAAIDPTLATQTKTYISGEQSTLTLSSAVTAGTPVVSVTKEVPQTGVTNNSWDVNSTAENYTRVNSAPATTLDFVGFDVSTANFVDAFSVSAQDTTPQDIAFNTDGTKMFIVGFAGQDVNEYTLSTGFDVSTATYSQNFSVSAQETSPQGIAFNTDGTKMFIVGYSGDDVNEYTLGTGFDVSTASYSQNFSVSAQDTGPVGIAFNNDGTKMFIVGSTGQDVNEYTLGTGFDVSTATFVDAFSVSAQDTNPRGIAFNTDGTKMFIVGTDGDDVNEYTLGTGFDVSTATYSQNFSVSAQEATPFGIAFNTDGNKMFIVGSTGDDVNEYDLSYSSVKIGTGSFTSADVGKTIYANSGELILTSTGGAFVETTAPSSYAQVASGDWEMYAVVYNTTDGDLELSGILDPDTKFDVSTASFVDSFSVASQETQPSGIAFNTDGTKMFVVGFAGDDVNEYTLGTGFDVSTASFVDAFSVSAQETDPRDMAFNSDGTKMFIVGTSGQDVNEYTLTTGFDVSTATYSQNFSVSAQETQPQGIAFNTDGTKMFILGTDGDDVNEYTLGTGFDVSTASYSQNFSVSAQDTFPYGLAFNNDGTKMFVVGGSGQDVNEYTLGTGFDVSTATYSQNFSVSAQEATPRGIAFNTDGTKMFIVGYGGQDVNEYNVGTISIPSGYNAAHTTASIDSTYWTDINSMTADESAGDGNVYYAVSTDDRTTWTVIDNTDGERDIVRNNGGTWEYNSNSTYGSETWTAASTNTELSALEEAMAEAENRMNKTQLEAVTDANHFTLGNDLDLAIIFNLSSGSTVPSSDGVSINYDANTLNEGAIIGTDYDFDFPATNKVRITALAANNLKVRVV
jgi:DNA-binding beta-propeller fold protein YncE